MENNKLLSAECAVLGSILSDSEICGQVFAERNEEYFITAEYNEIVRSAKKLFCSGKQVVVVTSCNVSGGD